MSAPEKSVRCQEKQCELHDLLLGEIEEGAKLQLELHLETCPTCRSAMEEAQRGLMALESLADFTFTLLRNRPLSCRRNDGS